MADTDAFNWPISILSYGRSVALHLAAWLSHASIAASSKLAYPQFAGLEVKATSSVNVADFRGLRRLREMLGPRFHCGLVLYDGDHVLPFGDGFLAVPLSALWTPTITTRPRKKLGRLKGKIRIPDDFNAPLPDDALDTFENS